MLLITNNHIFKKHMVVVYQTHSILLFFPNMETSYDAVFKVNATISNKIQFLKIHALIAVYLSMTNFENLFINSNRHQQPHGFYFTL